MLATRPGAWAAVVMVAVVVVVEMLTQLHVQLKVVVLVALLVELLARLRGNGRLLDELQAKTDRWWLRTLGRIVARVVSVAESDPCAKLGTRLHRQAQVDRAVSLLSAMPA